VSTTSAYDTDSVLVATLLHQPKTCLTHDDLDGLNFLYPACDNRLETPVCVSISRNIGWLRLFLTIFSTVFIPATLVLAFKLYCVLMLRCNKSITERKLRMERRQAETYLRLAQHPPVARSGANTKGQATVMPADPAAPSSGACVEAAAVPPSNAQPPVSGVRRDAKNHKRRPSPPRAAGRAPPPPAASGGGMDAANSRPAR